MRLLFALLLALAAPAAVAAADPVRLNFATPSLTALNWPNFVAQAEGFYAREGLDFELTLVEPKTILPSLISGAMDVALGNGADAVVADDKGADLVAVGSGADSNPYHLMSIPSVKSFADLRGKSIGTSGPLDTYTYVLTELLERHGLSPGKDVEFIAGGGQNQRIAALMSGAIAAGLVSAPYDLRLEQRGFNSLAYVPDSVPHMQASITLVRRSWVATHADVLRRYLRAQAEASRWLNDPAHKSEAIAILIKALKSTPAEADESYDAYIKSHFFANDFCQLRPGMEAVLTMLHEQGRTKSTPADVSKYVDPQWCPKAS